MAEVRPFCGIRYNHAVVKDLAAVICPPYDIITPQMEQELYSRSQHNFIRVEHARQLLQDSTMDNRYTRSATTLEEWLKQGVLVTDTEPSIYIHDHYFIHNGIEHKRRCLVARVRLEDWHRNIVRPHEGTLVEAKSDRLRLLWALKANTSPILVMYEDEDGYIPSLLYDQELGKPIINIDSYNVERHKLWALTDPQAIQAIGGFFAQRPLYIADGHHRYESALNYQRDQHAIYTSASENEAFNFVMMSLVAFDDPGLVILPPHRLIRGLPLPKMASLGDELKSFFDIEELPLSLPNIWKKVDRLLAD